MPITPLGCHDGPHWLRRFINGQLGATRGADQQQQTGLGAGPVGDYPHQRFGTGLPAGNYGCYIAPGFSAQWASGAEAASPESTPLCNGLDSDYTVTIARPANTPGLDKDLKVANQRENVLAQQAQAQAINNVADAIELNSMNGPGMGYGPYGYGGWGY